MISALSGLRLVKILPYAALAVLVFLFLGVVGSTRDQAVLISDLRRQVADQDRQIADTVSRANAEIERAGRVAAFETAVAADLREQLDAIATAQDQCLELGVPLELRDQ